MSTKATGITGAFETVKSWPLVVWIVAWLILGIPLAYTFSEWTWKTGMYGDDSVWDCRLVLAMVVFSAGFLAYVFRLKRLGAFLMAAGIIVAVEIPLPPLFKM